MAVVTATVVSAGVGAYSAYQSYDAAQDAKADNKQMARDRYKQAQSIDDQLAAEEKLYEEEQGLMEAENLLQGDKLDLEYDQQVAGFGFEREGLGLKRGAAETGLSAGLEQSLMQASTGFKQAGTQGRAAMAASGFAGAGIGADAGLRDAEQSMAFAQQQQTTQYGQTLDSLALSGRALTSKEEFAEEGHALSEDILAQQYEREKFGAYKDFESTKGELEARQQQLKPGYTKEGDKAIKTGLETFKQKGGMFGDAAQSMYDQYYG